MDADTKIGGVADRFPETHRSAVFELRCDDESTRSRAWDTVAAAYWKPLYKYARLKWNISNEDAKDLVQGFFRHAVELDFLGGYDEEKAGFRTFLRACFDRYAANERKASLRLKRGGGVEMIPIDESTPAAGQIEILFHQEWVKNVFSLAIDDLERECGEAGRRHQWEVFSLYDLAGEENRPSYSDIAAALNLTTATVTNQLAAARRRLRHIVLSRLRELTANDREYRNEARAVLGIEVE
jgi:RNA polymerase sigma factor (sigma-70 family)